MNDTYPIWHPFTQMGLSQAPLKVIRAKDTTIYLEDGKELLDMVSSWAVTLHGHANPYIARAIYEQALKLEQVIFANFTHEPAVTLAKRLLKHLPKSLYYMFFSDNGATAVEVAIKMAIQHWHNLGEKERSSVVCFEGAYHGDTIGAMSASGRSVFTDPFHPLMFHVLRAPFPSTYIDDVEVEEKEEMALISLKELFKEHSGKIAAVLIEPLLQGVGGMRICRSEFLIRLQEVVKEEGALLIYDEVMTGFGRVGEMFASIKSKTEPDIICLAKGLTGGFLPMGATICSQEVYQAFYSQDRLKTFFHGHSYTANPLGCAAALASLDLLEKEPYKKLEVLHLKHLERFRGHPKVRHLRVLGTIAAFDIDVENPGYLNDVGRKVQKFCLDRGIYIRPFGNVIYFFPPYCITEEQLAFAYDTLMEALSVLSSKELLLAQAIL